jgi:hypothetical protein
MDKITVYIAAASFIIIGALILFYLFKELKNVDNQDK